MADSPVTVGSVAYSPGNIYGATKWAVTGLAENTRRMVTATVSA